MTEPEIGDIGKSQFLSNVDEVLTVLKLLICNFKCNLMEGSFDGDLCWQLRYKKCSNTYLK